MNKKMNLNWSVDEITGNMPDISSMRSKEFQVKETSNTELLKDYLKRLGNGEDLESVKKDFVQNFSDVEASEIMKAEQELIKEGTPITEVQKLCDVHSALFHGLTKEEKIANAEKAVEESLKKEERSEMKIMPDAYVRKHELAKALRETKGHPLYSFTEENEKFSKEISDIRGALEKGEDVSKKISDFRQRKDAVYYNNDGTEYITGMKILPMQTTELKTLIKFDVRYPQIYKMLDMAYRSDGAPKEWYENSIVKETGRYNGQEI